MFYLKFVLIVLILSELRGENEEDCLSKCTVSKLKIEENLNKNERRLRIERADRVRKYDNVDEELSAVECGSVAVYNTTNGKRCRTCELGVGWSDIRKCDMVKCDRQVLTGDYSLVTYDRKSPGSDETLFEPGQVRAIFNNKTCRLCEPGGEWSETSDLNSCAQPLVKTPELRNCSLEELKRLERVQFDYHRLRIETADGSMKLNERAILDDSLPFNTVVLYQRYLMNMNHHVELPLIDSYKPVTPFLKKFCRYCDQAGQWSDIESCAVLNCDKDLLTGSPEILTSDMNSTRNLFKPYSAIAVYSFGSEKFCKQCHENGDWSRYSLVELCKNRTTGNRSTSEVVSTARKTTSGNRMTPNIDEMYRRESPCYLGSLNSIEVAFANATRKLIISADRKRKLNPVENASIPSRTLSVYEHENKDLCSICVNGVWSNISSRCLVNSDVKYCDRDKINNTGMQIWSTGMFMLDDGSIAAESQDLFEPGSVMVVYELSETTRVCKACFNRGDTVEWTKYAETFYCNPSIAYFRTTTNTQTTVNNNSRQRKLVAACSLKGLKLAELQHQNEYVRESIQSWDGKRIIISDRVDEFSMAVYASRSNEIKWCRKCFNARWDDYFVPCPVEFTIKKCNPALARNVNYFVYTSDGTRLDEEEASNLMYPGQVAAVYEFGINKYCKLCNENGTWSSYPQYQLCNLINW